MADTVDTLDIFKGTKKYVVRFTNISDGTGESAVAKVVKAGLTGPTGVAPSKLVVEEIYWSVQGFTSVRLHWNHTAADEIAVLSSGNGYMNPGKAGGLVDPASAGGTGDIQFTTAGAVVGATYDITLVIRLKE